MTIVGTTFTIFSKKLKPSLDISRSEVTGKLNIWLDDTLFIQDQRGGLLDVNPDLSRYAR